MSAVTHEYLVYARDNKIRCFFRWHCAKVQDARRAVRRCVDEDFGSRVGALDLGAEAEPKSSSCGVALCGIRVQRGGRFGAGALSGGGGGCGAEEAARAGVGSDRSAFLQRVPSQTDQAVYSQSSVNKRASVDCHAVTVSPRVRLDEVFQGGVRLLAASSPVPRIADQLDPLCRSTVREDNVPLREAVIGDVEQVLEDASPGPFDEEARFDARGRG